MAVEHYLLRVERKTLHHEIERSPSTPHVATERRTAGEAAIAAILGETHRQARTRRRRSRPVDPGVSQSAVAVEEENRTSRGVVGGRAGSHRINQKAEEGLAVRCGKVDAHCPLALHRRDYRWQKYEPFLECPKDRDR